MNAMGVAKRATDKLALYFCRIPGKSYVASDISNRGEYLEAGDATGSLASSGDAGKRVRHVRRCYG